MFHHGVMEPDDMARASELLGAAGAARARRAAPHGRAQPVAASAARTRGMSATLRARTGASLMTPSAIRRLISCGHARKDAATGVRIPLSRRARSGVAAAALAAAHELAQQRRVLGAVGEQLGVPLDAEAEAQRRVVERLDRAVRRVGAGDQPLAELVDGLVVEAVDVEAAAAGEAVQRRAGGP